MTVVHQKARFLPKQWMLALKNRKKDQVEKPRKKFISRVTRVLHTFRAKKVIKAPPLPDVPEDSRLPLLNLQPASNTGLVCHFSKVNYLLSNYQYVITSWSDVLHL